MRIINSSEEIKKKQMFNYIAFALLVGIWIMYSKERVMQSVDYF